MAIIIIWYVYLHTQPTTFYTSRIKSIHVVIWPNIKENGIRQLSWHASIVMASINCHDIHQLSWHASIVMTCIKCHDIRQLSWHASIVMACINCHGIHQLSWHPSIVMTWINCRLIIWYRMVLIWGTSLNMLQQHIVFTLTCSTW